MIEKITTKLGQTDLSKDLYDSVILLANEDWSVKTVGFTSMKLLFIKVFNPTAFSSYG